MAPIFEHCLTKDLRFFQPKQKSDAVLNEEAIRNVQLEGEKEKALMEKKLMLQIKMLQADVQRLAPEQGLNRRLKDQLDYKNHESIVNMLAINPTAKFTFHVQKPTSERYVSKFYDASSIPLSKLFFAPENRQP